MYERNWEGFEKKMRENDKDIQRQGAMKTKTKEGCVCVRRQNQEERTEAGKRGEIGREKSVYSGKCIREG